MWLAGPSLGRELRARALSHTAPVPAWHRLRSQSPSRVQTATSHNKWSAAHQVQQPWREEHVSADMFLDLPTMSAPSGEERRKRVQPHRSSALGYASAASAAHSRVYGACAAEAAASE